MPEDKGISLRRKLINHYRELRESKPERAVLIPALQDFAWRIGYVEAYSERLLAKGLYYDLIGIISEQRKPSRRKDRTTTFSTQAIKSDVLSASEDGYEIERGTNVFKDPLLCSIGQLEKMLVASVRQRTGDDRQVAYLAACYYKRTGKQFALPFEIPVEIQRAMMQKVDEDWNRLRGNDR